ncbi:unnamed protein product, partial [Polarella glacialis]
AQSMDLASAFLMYVRKCPHVMMSVKAFVAENCQSFAALGDCEEHKLEFTEVHQGFIALLDQRVEAFLRSQGASEEDFHAALVALQGGGAEEWKPFKTLIDKTDYHTFAKMMQIQAWCRKNDQEIAEGVSAGQ